MHQRNALRNGALAAKEDPIKSRTIRRHRPWLERAPNQALVSTPLPLLHHADSHRRFHWPSASCACAAPARGCRYPGHVLYAPAQKHPNRRPAPSRLSPTELSSECPRSHSPLPARTATSKTSLTARARSLVAARPRRHKAASSRPAASTVLRARSRSTVLTPSTPMAVGVLRLHQRHALAR